MREGSYQAKASQRAMRNSSIGVGPAFQRRGLPTPGGGMGGRTHTPLVGGWKVVGRVVGRALEMLRLTTGDHSVVGVQPVHGLGEIHVAVDQHG